MRDARQDDEKVLEASPDLLAHARMANLLLAEANPKAQSKAWRRRSVPAKRRRRPRDKALRDPTADAHVLHHAGLIYARAGDAAKGRRYLRRAADVNPKFNEFHFNH